MEMDLESVLVIGQLNLGVWVLGFLITMPRKEARWWWWWWIWNRTYSPQQQDLVLLSVSIDNIMSFNMTHHHLRGEGGGYSSKSSMIAM